MEPLFPKQQTAAEQQAEIIKNRFNQMCDSLGKTHQDIFDLLWRNQHADAQSICDALGAEASKIFFCGFGNGAFLACLYAHPSKWSHLRDAMAEMMVDNELTIPFAVANRHFEPLMEVTVNPDGTVTLTSYQEPE